MKLEQSYYPVKPYIKEFYGLISLTTVMISTISPRISKISHEINQRKEALIGEGNLKLLLCCSQKEYCNKPVISQYNILVRPWVVNSILPLCYYYTCTQLHMCCTYLFTKLCGRQYMFNKYFMVSSHQQQAFHITFHSCLLRMRQGQVIM